MKKIFLLPLLLGYAFAPAQINADSVALLTVPWRVDTVAEGIVWREGSFAGSLFGSNQRIIVLEMDARKMKATFDVAASPDTLWLTSAFGHRHRAIAALNGTFFDVKKGGSVDFVKDDGRVVNENRLSGGQRATHQKAAIVMQKRRLRIRKWNGKPGWERKLRQDDVMETGPLLLFEGQNQPLDSTAFVNHRHPRTCVALTKEKVLWVTVDGRSQEANGVSLPELADVVRWLGARDAVNLDGGGSTTLWIEGQPDNGVVNYPSDNQRFDHAGERKVANVLLLVPGS